MRVGWPALALALILSVWGCSGGDKEAAERSSEGEGAMVKAPDFSLPDLEGNTVKFSDFEGKVVLVDFWATWCGPCKLEVPHLVALHREYRDEGFEVIGIALDNGGAQVVEPFVKKNAIPYSVVIGNREVATAFGGLTAIPTAFLIDRSGNIVQKYVGYTDKAVFEEQIKQLL
jgi:thiol-disulfide isomerase/thioredoxin